MSMSGMPLNPPMHPPTMALAARSNRIPGKLPPSALLSSFLWGRSPSNAFRSANDHGDLNRSAIAQNPHRNMRTRTSEFDINRSAAHAETTQDDPVERSRQTRVPETDFPRVRREFDPKCRLNHQEQSTARPGLRRACHRIERRSGAAPSAKPAIELGQPPQIHIAGGGEGRFEHLVYMLLEPIARQTKRNERIVMRPDRAIVIRHRIVARLPLGDRSNAPARKEVRRDHRIRDAAGPVRPRNARP